MAKKFRDPFDVALTTEQREKLGLWLSNEIDEGLTAKAMQDAEVDYWHQIYEQARTRGSRNMPWADAADLTSFLACEKVDALHARAMHTIFGPAAEPVCTVEGYGEAAAKAPFVEEFHQWKSEEERLKSEFDAFLQTALIEPRGLVEIYEGSEWRTVRKSINAKVQVDPLTGGFTYEQEGNPVLEQDGDGLFVEAQEGEFAVEQIIDAFENQRTGPQYRLLPYSDSLILPGHARDKQEIWGYCKKINKRYSEIVACATGPRAIYDKASVEKLTTTDEREPDKALERSGTTVATQDETTAQKELWEMTILLDLKQFFMRWGIKTKGLKDEGARWYVVTVHKDQHVVLRLQHDDMDRGRYVCMILFPRPKRVTEGFSYIGNKLITVVEEHTAYRNMAADRSSLANNVPMMRTVGALWDPEEQAFAPKAVIDVRDPREITQMKVSDVPQSVFEHIDRCERTAERLAGINDVASGQVAREDRTLGEVQMATEQSFVRMDLVIGRAQEALEDIYQIRHAIYKRTLAENQDGVDPSPKMLVGLEAQGVSIDQMMPDKKVTAALLDGAFRFKPHGSVSTADPAKNRQDFVGAMQFMPMLLQAFPFLAMQFQSPQAGKAIAREFVRLFRLPNPQAFLGSPAADLAQGGMLPGMFPAGGMAPPVAPVGQAAGMSMLPPGAGAPVGSGQAGGAPPEGLQ